MQSGTRRAVRLVEHYVALHMKAMTAAEDDPKHRSHDFIKAHALRDGAADAVGITFGIGTPWAVVQDTIDVIRSAGPRPSYNLLNNKLQRAYDTAVVVALTNKWLGDTDSMTSVEMKDTSQALFAEASRRQGGVTAGGTADKWRLIQMLREAGARLSTAASIAQREDGEADDA